MISNRPIYRYADINPTGSLKREIGINIQFQQPEVFMSTYTTKQQVKNQLVNYILTNPGERIFQPYYGAGVRNLLFQQNSLDFDSLEENLKTGIERNVQNIIVNFVNIVGDNENGVNININYSINGITEEVNVEIIA
jgi:uncharacterized protein